MKPHHRLPASVLALAFVAAAPLHGQADSEVPEFWLLPKVVHRAAESIRASVVTVETFGGFRKVLEGAGGKPKVPAVPGLPKPPGKDGDKDKDKKKGLGPIRMPGFIQAQGASTGLVISKDGWIVTSSFALNWDPSTVLVTLDDGRKFTASVGGTDETRGITLLRVEAEDLPVPEFAPPGTIEVGQWAFAIARSLAGKGPTVHVGAISALDRISGKAIQCDTNTSPANYGGPLVDIQGRVLGLIVPLAPAGEAAGVDWYDSGIGFAAKLQGLDDVITRLEAGETLKRGKLGIALDPSSLGPGAMVVSTPRGSAGHGAGLKKGDKILAVDGVSVRHSMHLQDAVGHHYAGDWVELRYERKRDSGVVDVLVRLDG
ncbi:MAG: trypsin-like peptidase domain-containing protein [Planctomycetes bacterium]|nr:trypsin-like peptidase domain-containing protein [Planctomycetota bacterium]